MAKPPILSDEEMEARVEGYWELYNPLWNEGEISEVDFDSGYDYWRIEAQRDADAEYYEGKLVEAYRDGFNDGQILSGTMPGVH